MTKEEILKAKFHGFSDSQWEELKEQFPYNEMPCAMETYADEKNKELKEIIIQLQNDFVLKLDKVREQEWNFYRSIKNKDMIKVKHFSVKYSANGFLESDMALDETINEFLKWISVEWVDIRYSSTFTGFRFEYSALLTYKEL